jgi:hypothetical protein
MVTGGGGRKFTNKRTKRVVIPNQRIPRLPQIPRNPRGWGTTQVRIRARGIPGSNKFDQPEPAGDPPAWFKGTRPEWAIYWGLMQNGLQPEEDFVYLAKMPGYAESYYSTLDFLISDFHIGIEVQGEFWHYGQGSDKIAQDTLKRAFYAGLGLTIIGIDAQDALRAPKFYAAEALKGEDHSKMRMRMG